MAQPSFEVQLIISTVLGIVVGVVTVFVGLVLEYHTGWFKKRLTGVSQPGSTQTTRTGLISLLAHDLFGSWDRTFLTLSIIMGLLAMTLTALRLDGLDSALQLVIARDFLIYGVWVCIVIAVLYRNLLGQRTRTSQEQKISQLEQTCISLEQKISQLELQLDAQKQVLLQTRVDMASHLEAAYQMIKEAHQALRSHKRQAFLHFLPVIPSGDISRMSDTEFTLFRSICRQVTDGVRISLRRYFESRGINIGEDIAVTVKLVLKREQLLNLPDFYERIHTSREYEAMVNAKEQWVITVYRDTYTYDHHPEREVGQGENIGLYDIGRNTAFHEIAVGEPDYCSDDLQARSLSHAYHNDNPKWPEQYNSTLVVPIGYHSIPGKPPLLFGFLAVDSLNKRRDQLYDNPEARNIMYHGADLLAVFQLLIALHRQKADNDKEGLC